MLSFRRLIRKPTVKAVSTTNRPPNAPYNALSHRLLSALAATLSAANRAIVTSRLAFSVTMVCAISRLAVSTSTLGLAASMRAASEVPFAFSNSAIFVVAIAISVWSFSIVCPNSGCVLFVSVLSTLDCGGACSSRGGETNPDTSTAAIRRVPRPLRSKLAPQTNPGPPSMR